MQLHYPLGWLAPHSLDLVDFYLFTPKKCVSSGKKRYPCCVRQICSSQLLLSQLDPSFYLTNLSLQSSFVPSSISISFLPSQKLCLYSNSVFSLPRMQACLHAVLPDFSRNWTPMPTNLVKKTRQQQKKRCKEKLIPSLSIAAFLTSVSYQFGIKHHHLATLVVLPPHPQCVGVSPAVPSLD